VTLGIQLFDLVLHRFLSAPHYQRWWMLTATRFPRTLTGERPQGDEVPSAGESLLMTITLPCRHHGMKKT
jgi:hypothetical protein